MAHKINFIKNASILLVSAFILSACSLTSIINPQQPAPTASAPTPTSTFSVLQPSPTGSAGIKPTQSLLQNQDVISINTAKGQILIKLYTKDAPKSSANFIKKADSGFYDGLTFHRVEPGFVIQGGDPKGDGTGGGSIASELNQITFKRGSVGLARGPNRDISNDSQFFICLSDENCSNLTGDYVNFGEVVQGMDVVDKIAVGDKIISATSKTK